jgi:hypothetical protein
LFDIPNAIRALEWDPFGPILDVNTELLLDGRIEVRVVESCTLVDQLV